MATKGKTLKQVIHLPGTPRQAYDLLMTTKGHQAFSGAKARISGQVDGLCSAYDGYCEARNVQLEPGLLIVQAWRATDWEEGWWSTASWDFASAKGGGTKLTFTQKGIPAKDYEDIKQGWVDYYWEPMKAYLAKQAG